METTLKHPTGAIFGTAKKERVSSVAKVSAYNKWIESLKFSYYGIITMSISISSILGGLAAMAIHAADASIWQLCFCAAISMANNVMCIGQAPMKWIVNTFFLSVIINVLLIVINVI